MKYRGISVFIIISIFLLISIQFASAGDIRTLRIGDTLELNDGYCVTLTNIDAEGYGRAWIEFQKDGIHSNGAFLEHGETYTSIAYSGGTSLTLINVFQGGSGDYLAQFDVEMPVEEVTVEEPVYGVQVQKLSPTPTITRVEIMRELYDTGSAILEVDVKVRGNSGPVITRLVPNINTQYVILTPETITENFEKGETKTLRFTIKGSDTTNNYYGKFMVRATGSTGEISTKEVRYTLKDYDLVDSSNTVDAGASSSNTNPISGFSGFLLLLSLIIGEIIRKR